MSRYDNERNKLIDLEYDIMAALKALESGRGCVAVNILEDALEDLTEFLQED